VLAVDYRGFGDSTGVPSQEGLVQDGIASWNWLTDNGAAPSDVVIMGQSLGTAVSVRLGAWLADHGEPRFMPHLDRVLILTL
jgi:abhydrolase domain-containing protein 12